MTFIKAASGMPQPSVLLKISFYPKAHQFATDTAVEELRYQF
jgi:hypothetical protein